jgi:hypothetical protein
MGSTFNTGPFWHIPWQPVLTISRSTPLFADSFWNLSISLWAPVALHAVPQHTRARNASGLNVSSFKLSLSS